MGKASKWFRAILGLKKPDPPLPQEQQQQQQRTSRSKEKRRWSFVNSYREKDSTYHHSGRTKRGVSYSQDSSASLVQISSVDFSENDLNKPAIAVAEAASEVAKRAVVAAHAADAVVRLTSSGRCTNNAAAVAYVSGSFGWHEDLVAIKIQSAFRGYLARRALRALKALVRLQALVRGHVARKQTAVRFHQIQAVLRAQARAHVVRAQISESSHSSTKYSHFHQPGPLTPEKFEHSIQAKSGKYERSSILKRNSSKSIGSRAIDDPDKVHLSFNWSEHQMDERSLEQRLPSTRTGTVDDEKSDKILKIDNGKLHFTPKCRNLFHSHHASDQYSHSFTTSKDSTIRQSVPSQSSDEVQSHLSPLQFLHEVEEVFCPARNSPQLYSASSRGGSGKKSPFTPTKSDGSRSILSSYSNYPNYMSYTESSRAKVRSLSAPKQRSQYERSSSSVERYSIHGLGEPRSSSAQRAPASRASFTSKAYPGSGHLDRLGMPIDQRY